MKKKRGKKKEEEAKNKFWKLFILIVTFGIAIALFPVISIPAIIFFFVYLKKRKK